MYSVSPQALSQAFYGIEIGRIEGLAALCFLYRIQEESYRMGDVAESDIPPEIATAADQLGITRGLDQFATVWVALKSVVLPSNRIDFRQLVKLFNNDTSAVTELDAELVLHLVCPAVRQIVLILTLVSMKMSADVDQHPEFVQWMRGVEDEYFTAPVTSPDFGRVFDEGRLGLVSALLKDGQPTLLFFTQSEHKWDVFALQREVVRSFWATEIQSQVFWGEEREERPSIQSNWRYLHNLILQGISRPVGYPAFVSPVLTSYDFLGW
jgi:hypothetical protein